MTYQDARAYLDSCEKYGNLDVSDYGDLTEQEQIDLAGELMAKGDAAYDAWKEEHGSQE